MNQSRKNNQLHLQLGTTRIHCHANFMTEHTCGNCSDNKWNKNRKEQMKAEAAEKKKESGSAHAIASVAKQRP